MHLASLVFVRVDRCGDEDETATSLPFAYPLRVAKVTFKFSLRNPYVHNVSVISPVDRCDETV